MKGNEIKMIMRNEVGNNNENESDTNSDNFNKDNNGKDDNFMPFVQCC